MDCMERLLKRLDIGREHYVDVKLYTDNTTIFLDTLLHRLRHLDLAPEVPVEMVDGDVPDVDVDDLPPEGARDLAMNINLFDFGQEEWNWLFGHLTGVSDIFVSEIDDEWFLEGLYVNHRVVVTHRELLPLFEGWLELKTVQAAIQKVKPKCINWATKKEAMAAENKMALSIGKLGPKTLAYQAAATCATCWVFLNGIVSQVDAIVLRNLSRRPWSPETKTKPRRFWLFLDGYDVSGMSWLSIAIEHDNMLLIQWLVQNLTVEQLDNIQVLRLAHPDDTSDKMHLPQLLDPDSLTICADLSPWAHLIEKRNLQGIWEMLYKYKSEESDLSWLGLSHVKLKLCTFASRGLAEDLRLEYDVDIANCDSEKSRTTTPLHEAVRENPHGEGFLDWLRYRSGVDLNTTRNASGETALEHAIKHRKTEPISWLCRHMDFTRSKPFPPVRELQVAAYAMNQSSIEIFQILLQELPPTHTQGFKVAKDLFGYIYDPFWRFKGNLIPRENDPDKEWFGWGHYDGRFEPMSIDDASEIAVGKCQLLINHLPSSWTGSQEQKEICARVGLVGPDFLIPYMTGPVCSTRNEGTKTQREASSSGRRSRHRARDLVLAKGLEEMEL